MFIFFVRKHLHHLRTLLVICCAKWSGENSIDNCFRTTSLRSHWRNNGFHCWSHLGRSKQHRLQSDNESYTIPYDLISEEYRMNKRRERKIMNDSSMSKSYWTWIWTSIRATFFNTSIMYMSCSSGKYDSLFQYETIWRKRIVYISLCAFALPHWRWMKDRLMRKDRKRKNPSLIEFRLSYVSDEREVFSHRLPCPGLAISATKSLSFRVRRRKTKDVWPSFYKITRATLVITTMLLRFQDFFSVEILFHVIQYCLWFVSF